MKLPFDVDLSKKIVAITGAGGVICSEFARALATCGARRLSGQTEYYGCQGNNRGIFRKS